MNNTPEIVFLGGIFTKEQNNFIAKNSVGVIQNAADTLQKHFLDGLRKNIDTPINIINLPFVGSFPRAFKKSYFPSHFDFSNSQLVIRGPGFLNIFLIKFFSRFTSATRAMKHVANTSNPIIFIYSAHLPFILAALFKKFVNPSVKICIIVPDLPEHMGGSGLTHILFGKLNIAIFYLLVRRLDYFVVLTRHMIAKLGVDPSKCSVVEGIADDCNHVPLIFKCQSTVKPSKRYFLYSGTLAERYGIRDLVVAFDSAQLEDLSLVICGEGDSRDYVKAAAARNRQIIYLGQLPRDEVISLQRSATALINPRKPEGLYTKYSFPSKVMEYMASGRPVVMHKLEGIPDDYDSHYISPESTDADALARCLVYISKLSDDALDEIGNNAKQFVLQNKNAQKQVKKVLDVIFKGTSC